MKTRRIRLKRVKTRKVKTRQVKTGQMKTGQMKMQIMKGGRNDNIKDLYGLYDNLDMIYTIIEKHLRRNTILPFDFSKNLSKIEMKLPPLNIELAGIYSTVFLYNSIILIIDSIPTNTKSRTKSAKEEEIKKIEEIKNELINLITPKKLEKKEEVKSGPLSPIISRLINITKNVTLSSDNKDLLINIIYYIYEYKLISIFKVYIDTFMGGNYNDVIYSFNNISKNDYDAISLSVNNIITCIGYYIGFLYYILINNYKLNIKVDQTTLNKIDFLNNKYNEIKYCCGVKVDDKKFSKNTVTCGKKNDCTRFCEFPITPHDHKKCTMLDEKKINLLDTIKTTSISEKFLFFLDFLVKDNNLVTTFNSQKMPTIKKISKEVLDHIQQYTRNTYSYNLKNPQNTQDNLKITELRNIEYIKYIGQKNIIDRLKKYTEKLNTLIENIKKYNNDIDNTVESNSATKNEFLESIREYKSKEDNFKNVSGDLIDYDPKTLRVSYDNIISQYTEEQQKQIKGLNDKTDIKILIRYYIYSIYHIEFALLNTIYNIVNTIYTNMLDILKNSNSTPLTQYSDTTIIYYIYTIQQKIKTIYDLLQPNQSTIATEQKNPAPKSIYNSISNRPMLYDDFFNKLNPFQQKDLTSTSNPEAAITFYLGMIKRKKYPKNYYVKQPVQPIAVKPIKPARTQDRKPKIDTKQIYNEISNTGMTYEKFLEKLTDAQKQDLTITKLKKEAIEFYLGIIKGDHHSTIYGTHMYKPEYKIYSEYYNDLMLQNKYTEIRDTITINKTMEFNTFLEKLSSEQKEELDSNINKLYNPDVLKHYINMKINGVKYSTVYANKYNPTNNHYNDKTYSTYNQNSLNKSDKQIR